VALQRILYLENDPAVRELTAMILESLNGFTLETCGTLPELAIKARSFQPDVILLDSVASELEAAETLADLCADNNGVNAPLIIIAAADSVAKNKPWRKLGASGVLAKPVNPMMMADQLRRACHDASPRRVIQ